MNILLVGHECCPGLGSESGFTWNWAWYLSARHKVWLLTHDQHRPQIERYLQSHPNPALQIEWAGVRPWADPWRPAMGDQGLSLYRLHLHYLLWQRAAFRRARELNRRIGFDVCHYVSWGSVSAAPPLWKLPVPFFWGPLGGGQIAPMRFRKYLGSGWTREAMRAARIHLRRRMPSLRRAAAGCALALATNCETVALLRAVGARNIRLFLDSGLPETNLAGDLPVRGDRPYLLLHWSGRLEPRKALPLALEAIASVKNADVRLEVSGDGPERGRCQRLCDRFGISDRVTFLGRVPREVLFESFRRADALVWTSLQDSFGSVMLEAMGQGLPVIGLDHQGMRTFVPDDAAWKAPVLDPPQTVEALARAISEAAANPVKRRERARAALRFASTQSWPRRIVEMETLYEMYRTSPRGVSE